jgi:DNA modification methylase
MDAIPDGSVGVAVTSPPYWNLKDYFKEGQIGQESYEDYLGRMEAVWRQCYAKLRPDGSLWVNINVRRQNGKVILIPLDFVEMCRRIGFFYKGIFLWHKSSGIPTGEKNIVDRHEYVLLFSKQADFSVPAALQAEFQDYKHPAMNGGVFWNINRKAGSVGKKYIHPAIYPNELVRRIVLLTTAPGETVLDPFLGSGTSLIAALSCGRSFAGYEFNDGFRELMESRFEKELPGDSSISFLYPDT